MGPNPIWPLTLKEGGRHCEDRDVGRRQSLVTGRGCRDAPRGRACRQPPGLGGQGRFYPESQRGWPPGTSIADFRLPDCERSCCSCCSSAPVCGTLLRQPLDTNKEDNLTPFCTRGKGAEVQGTPPVCLSGKSSL